MATIYVRQSMDRDGEGMAVERQEELCRVYAAERGWEVGQVYRDNDISATTGKTRPGFEALLRDKPEVVVVWHQDRLLRVSRDLERVLTVGLTVHQVTAGSLDLATPTGRAVARTIAAWSTYEGEHKSERQKASIRQRAARGDQWWSHRPFGYEMDLSIREDEARYLRQAFTDILNGKSSYAIAKEWNEAGVKMPESPNPWQGRRVTQLLGQPRYVGQATYKGEVVGQGKWEPIVDEGTFYAVQAILSDPKRKVGGAPRYSLLSGILRCGRCGGAMNRWKGKRRSGTLFDRYRCNGCQFIVDTEWAEGIVKDELFTFLLDADAEVTDSPAPDDSELKRLEGRLVDLAEAYAREDITLAQLTAGTKSLEAKIEDLRRKAVAEATTSRTASIDDIRENWGSMTTDEKRESISRYWNLTAVKGEDGTKRIVWEPTGRVERREGV